MQLLRINPLLIIAVSFTAVCSSYKLNDRIYNGQDAQLGLIPYQALLYMPQSTNSLFFCGGTLISPAFVLTIAQCILSDNITIMLGVVDLSSPNQPSMFMTKAFNTYVHPEFDRFTLANDIALAQLRNQYRGGNNNIATISLPPRAGADPTFYDNQNGIVSGWGETYLSEFIHRKLQYAKVHVMPHEQCVKNLSGTTEITDKQLCTDKVIPSSPCRGDGGGALAVTSGGKTVVAGLFSFNVGGCNLPSPAGYTNVAPYLDWISSYTGLAV